MLREEVIEYALSRFQEELKKALRNADGQMAGLEQKKKKLEKEARNLATAIASGLDSATLRVELVDRERQIAEITAQVTAAKPETVRTKIRDARRFVESSLKDIRKLLNTDPATAKATLARHMATIVLKPEPGRKYQVVSEWELLPGGAAGYTSGAGGGNWTERLPLAFGWLAAA